MVGNRAAIFLFTACRSVTLFLVGEHLCIQTSSLTGFFEERTSGITVTPTRLLDWMLCGDSQADLYILGISVEPAAPTDLTTQTYTHRQLLTVIFVLTGYDDHDGLLAAPR